MDTRDTGEDIYFSFVPEHPQPSHRQISPSPTIRIPFKISTDARTSLFTWFAHQAPRNHLPLLETN